MDVLRSLPSYKSFKNMLCYTDGFHHCSLYNVVSMLSNVEDDVLVAVVENSYAVKNLNTVEAMSRETVENNNADGLLEHGQCEDKANPQGAYTLVHGVLGYRTFWSEHSLNWNRACWREVEIFLEYVTLGPNVPRTF